MKKFLFMAASAALVLSSCSNEIDEVSNLNSETGKKEIKVATYTPGMTRAVEADFNSLMNDGFWLYATSGSETIINSHYMSQGETSGNWVPAILSDDTWVASGDIYYWPESSVSFYGVYDGSSNDECPLKISEDGSSVSYECSINYDSLSQKDIMVATAGTSLTQNKSSEIQLSFEHILAEVQVQVKGAVEGFTYNLYGISLNALNSSVYDFEKNAFYSTTDVEPVDYTIKSQALTNGDSELQFDPYQYTADYPYNTIDTLTQDYKQFGGTLMVLPGEATLKIGYVILLGEDQIAYEVSKEAEVTLVAGKKNVIQVTLNPGNVPMSVSAIVDDWKENNVEKVLTTEEGE